MFFEKLNESEKLKVEKELEKDVEKYKETQKETLALWTLRKKYVLRYWEAIETPDYEEAVSDLEEFIGAHGSFNLGMHKFKVEGEYQTLRITI